jgi:hypothetical protein
MVIKLRRMIWARYISRIRQTRNGYKILVGIPERKLKLMKPNCKWEDNIRRDVKD